MWLVFSAVERNETEIGKFWRLRTKERNYKAGEFVVIETNEY